MFDQGVRRGTGTSMGDEKWRDERDTIGSTTRKVKGKGTETNTKEVRYHKKREWNLLHIGNERRFKKKIGINETNSETCDTHVWKHNQIFTTRQNGHIQNKKGVRVVLNICRSPSPPVEELILCLKRCTLKKSFTNDWRSTVSTGDL